MRFRIALALDPLDEVAQHNLLQTWVRQTQPGTPGQR